MTAQITLVVFNPLPQRARQRRVQALCVALEQAKRPYMLVATDAKLAITAATIRLHLAKVKDIIVVGGDGTLHQVVNALGAVHNSLAVGYVPAGTGNDFARGWFAKPYCTAEYIERALYGTPKTIDIGQVNDRYFINSVGIGFDGDLTRRLAGRKSWWPRLTYLLCALKQLFVYRGVVIEMSGSNSSLEDLDKEPTLLFVAANNRYFGAGMLIAPQANYNDGQLAWVHVQECRLFKKLKSFASIYNGSHLAESVVTSGHVTAVEIKTPNIPMQTDGEFAAYTPATIRCIPNALYIRR